MALKAGWISVECSVFTSLGRTVGPAGPFFPSCLPGTLLNTATYAQALSHVASLKGKIRGRLEQRVGRGWRLFGLPAVSGGTTFSFCQSQAGSQAPCISILAVLFGEQSGF